MLPESFQLKACFYIHSNWKDLFCFPGIHTEVERAAGGNIMLQTHQVLETCPSKGPVVAHPRGLCSTGREEQDPGCAASPQSRTCCTSIPDHGVAQATSLLCTEPWLCHSKEIFSPNKTAMGLVCARWRSRLEPRSRFQLRVC